MNEAESSGTRSIKAAIYCRVSTEDQAKEGFSLQAQEDRLRAYCMAKEWIIFKVYVDEGYSGRYADRPAYRQMMLERDMWDVLVVMKMDRIHRNSKNFTLMMEELKSFNKEFTSMQESFDTTTAMGRFVMDIIQRIAQLESEQIGERVYVGMRQKAKEGKGILGFAIPYGYKFIDGKLVLDQDESSIICEIFSQYNEGYSIRGIARELKRKNIRTKKGRINWDPKTIFRILSNPLYCGYHRWDDVIYAGDMDTIIGRELFERVQSKLHRRTDNPKIELPPLNASTVS